MNRQRDSQRSKMYAAEKLFEQYHSYYGVGTLPTVPIIECYCDELLEKAWFKKEFPFLKKVDVECGRARRRAACYPSSYVEGYPTEAVIYMPRKFRNEVVTLHEVAHGLTLSEVPWHGWQFAKIYLYLIRKTFGVEAEDCLKRCFKIKKVRYKAPKKLSPETRAKLSARMKKFQEEKRMGV